MKIASKASTTIQKSGFRNKAFGAYAIIIMILTIIIIIIINIIIILQGKCRAGWT